MPGLKKRIAGAALAASTLLANGCAYNDHLSPPPRQPLLSWCAYNGPYVQSGELHFGGGYTVRCGTDVRYAFTVAQGSTPENLARNFAKARSVYQISDQAYRATQTEIMRANKLWHHSPDYYRMNNPE